jgi:hypothetical protein
MRIDKPKFVVDQYNNFLGEVTYVIRQDDFDMWFDTHIAPLNKALVKGHEIYTVDEDSYFTGWHKKEDLKKAEPTHKGWIFNIEKIEPASSEERIERLVKRVENSDMGYGLKQAIKDDLKKLLSSD